MQKLASEQYPGLVPKVLGESELGFVQEFAGKAIDNKALAAKKTEEAWRGMFTKKGEGLVRHLDPSKSNIVRQGSRIRMIDFGVSAQVTSFTRDTQSAAKKALKMYKETFEDSITKNKKTRVFKQQAMHTKAVTDMTKNTLRPGRGHTSKTGKIVQ